MQTGSIFGGKMGKSEAMRLRLIAPSVPNVRAVSGNMILSSDYTEGAEYYVNCSGQTCTCENFRKRSHMPINDWRRWCKHLVRALHMSEALDELSDNYATILSLCAGGPTAAYALEAQGMPCVLLLVSESDEWLNVLARQKKANESAFAALGEYRRYGWSIHQKRWSHVQGPPGQSRINHFLKSIESWSDLADYARQDILPDFTKKKVKEGASNAETEHERRLALDYMTYLNIFFFVAVQDGKLDSHDLLSINLFFKEIANIEWLDEEVVRRILRFERKFSGKYSHGRHRAKFFQALDYARENRDIDIELIKKTSINITRGDGLGQNNNQLVAEDMIARRLGREDMPFNPRWQLS